MRIILADHHPQALWALKMLLSEGSEYTITGDAVDTDGLLALTRADPPDLVLMDSDLPGRSILETIDELRAIKPRPIIVVMGSKPEAGRMLLKAGADAFVSKSDHPEWLLETLAKFENRLYHANGA